MTAYATMARDLKLPTGIFVDGGYCPSATGRSFATETPYAREPIAELPACDGTDVDAAVAFARAAFEAGQRVN
jgi:gamma-glutamyl-gamma-aminobutyraldehyde dehydrogenase